MDRQLIVNNLFSGTTRLYCILDGILVPDLPNRLYDAQVPNHCLSPGDLPPDMVYAAPYLVYLSRDSKFSDWVFENGIGKSWGIFAHSRRSMIEMRRHFLSLLQAYDERGNPMKFRYYDPRVLSKFLPTCNGGELRTLFGDVEAFFADGDKQDELSRFKIADGKLETTVIS